MALSSHICPTMTIIAQVEGEFLARGFDVSLAKLTVNCYLSIDMVGGNHPQNSIQTARPCRQIVCHNKAGQLQGDCAEAAAWRCHHAVWD